MIEVTPKIWRAKQENKYRVPDYSNDIDDIIFGYKVYGKSLFNPNISWEARNRYDVIVFDCRSSVILHVELSH